jgi:hypothetical protein
MTSPMIHVSWSRAELLTVKEAIDLTPYFEGRTEVRDMVRRAVRPGQLGEVSLDRETAERFAGRLVAVDLATSLAKVRLLRALQESATVADRASSKPPASKAA